MPNPPAAASAYRELWQTWTLLHPHRGDGPADAVARSTAANAVAGGGSEGRVIAPAHETTEWRHRIQRARIEQRWSLADLATHVKCDVRALAAYERGDEVLDATVHRVLCRTLSL